MAQCMQTPQDFIKNAFTPQIAVMCSPEAERACQKNNLSFIELLQPFSKLNNDVFYKDANGIVVTIKNLKLTFLDINARPPQTAIARKYLNSSVSDATDPRTQTVNVKGYSLDIPASTPWFEAWRETFMMVQYPSDHEYTKHFLSCIFVASTLDSKPAETITSMSQAFIHIINNSQGSLPKWFSSNALKYYVILHDNVDGDTKVANETYESVKVSYGATNTFLLKINSRPADAFVTEHLPDPWSQFISSNIVQHKQNKATPESSPNSPRNNIVLEVGQEANEGKVETTYHPLSPVCEDFSQSEFDPENEKMSSKGSSSKEHGFCLSIDDIEQVKLMVYEFCRAALLPFVERQIQILNEGVSNKKGVSRSLFSATKRWFNPNKPGASAVTTTNLMYMSDSPELQIRKLGDLYFMFGNYSGAFQAYHNAKRDYNTDQAWLYYAGALEMASLSAFMANEISKKTCDYMEESISTYLNTCKMPQFATRATLLSTECLKNRSMYGEAAHQFIRMTSEDSDLRSALLLEQAAYCFLHSKMIRKYAFHMVLSGHRFSKAAQRKHSLRCYKQAHQIYRESGWDLAEDHIHYTIGRQANNLQQYGEAVESFAKLLRGESKQSADQQYIFLKEYLTILSSKLENSDVLEIPMLPVPHLDNDSIKILTAPAAPLMTPGKHAAKGINFEDDIESCEEMKWQKLEEMLVQESQGNLPIIFKPQNNLYTKHKLLKLKPIAVIHEPIRFSISFVNNLQIPLTLRDIQLVWSFNCTKQDIKVTSDDENCDKFIKTHILKTAVVPESSHQNVVLVLTPLSTGEVSLLGVSYTLFSSGSLTDNVFVRGRQLFDQTNESSANKNVLTKVDVAIVPPTPCMQVLFTEVSPDFLCDEIQKVDVSLQNTGAVALDSVLIATSVPNLVSTCEFKDTENMYAVNSSDAPVVRDKLGRKNHVNSVSLPNNKLIPGQTTNLSLWIRAPNKKGPIQVDLLIYYENSVKNAVPKYRLVRHYWNLTVQESIEVEVQSRLSYQSKLSEEITLSVTTTNLNKTHYSYTTEITLLNVGLLSETWKLTNSLIAPKYINLHSQESAHIFLKAERVNSKNDNFKKEDVIKTAFSNSIFSSIPLNTDRKVIKNIFKACLAFSQKSEQRIIDLFNTENTENCTKNENGIVLIQWQALITDASRKRIVNGQTHVPLEIVRRKKDPYESMEEAWILTDFSNLINENVVKKQLEDQEVARQNQVTYNLTYPASVKQCFEKEKLCIVNVVLHIHSIIEIPITVRVYTTEPLNEVALETGSLFSPYASSSFKWIGKSNVIFTLDPFCSKEYGLKAAFPTAGAYDLGAHIKITCVNNNDNNANDEVVQTFRVQSALIVVDSEV